jgi:hypothetical protein
VSVVFDPFCGTGGFLFRLLTAEKLMVECYVENVKGPIFKNSRGGAKKHLAVIIFGSGTV